MLAWLLSRIETTRTRDMPERDTKQAVVSQDRMLKVFTTRREKGFRVLPSAEAPLLKYRKVEPFPSRPAAP